MYLPLTLHLQELQAVIAHTAKMSNTPTHLYIAEPALSQHVHRDILLYEVATTGWYTICGFTRCVAALLVQEQQQQDALAALCAQHTAALAAAAQEANERIVQTEADHAALHMKQRSDAEAALKEAWQQEQGQHEADFASEMSSLKQLHAQSLCDMHTQHQSQLRQIQAELHEAYQHEVASLTSTLAEEHQAELSRQQQLSQQTAVESADLVALLRAQQQQALLALQTEHSVLIEQLQTEHQQSKSEQSQAFADQMQELQDRQRRERACTLSQAQEGAAAVMRSVQAEQDAHTEQLQQQLQQSQEQLTAMAAEHAQELAAANAQYLVCYIHRCLTVLHCA